MAKKKGTEPTKETEASKIMWEKTKKSLSARPGGQEMIRREQAARDSLMKAGKPVPGSMKKGGSTKVNEDVRNNMIMAKMRENKNKKR